MRAFALALVVVLSGHAARAEEDSGREVADGGAAATALVAVSGVVRSRGNRQPVALARVAADDGAPAYTDSEGRFSMQLPAGMHQLQATAAGFAPGSWRETLNETRALQVIYGLTPLRVNPFETVVRGEKERTEVSRIGLHDAELREVPGTMGDPFRVVMVLPGVSSIVSGLAYPVVRGSSPASTGTFIDGIRVPELFHVFLGPAVVHPELLDGLDFYAGGAPVKYGRLTGGAIEGRLARPRDDGVHLSVSADLINAGVLAEIPVKATDTHLTLAGRFSYMGLLLGPLSPLITGPTGPRLSADFWDYQARIDQGLLGGRLQLFAFGSSDLLATTYVSAAQTSTSQTIAFHRVDARYRHPLGPGELTARVTWGLDRFGFTSLSPLSAETFGTRPPEGQALRVTDVAQRSLTAKLHWAADVTPTLRFASEASVESMRASFSQHTHYQPVGGDGFDDASAQPLAVATFLAGWVEGTYHLGPTAMTLGVRIDHTHLLPRIDHSTADPRFSISRAVTERFSARASVGLFHQPPTFLISVPVVDLAGLAFGSQEVLQTSSGFTWKLWHELELSADAYVNPMTRTAELAIFGASTDLLEPIKTGSDLTVTSLVSRPGLAYGLDLMLRLPQQGHWFGWLSLSLQRSTRLTTFNTYDAGGTRTGVATAQLPSSYDQTVVANAVFSYRFDNGVSLGATVHFNSGRPEDGQLTSRTRLPGLDDQGRPQWIRVSADHADRLPPYLRLDLRVAKTWIFDRFTLEAWLDVLNATVSGEVVSYDYASTAGGTLTKTPNTVPVIIPSLGVKGRY